MMGTPDGDGDFLTQAIAATGRTYTCRMAEILTHMDLGLRLQVEEALASPRVSPRGIITALATHGYRVAYGSVERHRKGHCSCG